MAPKLKSGFRGERIAAYSSDTIYDALKNPLTSALAVHSMGYFPNAENHCIVREEGCNEYVLVYCVKGSGYYIYNGIKNKISAQQFFVIPANSAHEIGSSENNPWSIYWIHFKGSNASLIADRLSGVNNISESTISRITDRISLLDEMLNIMEYSKDGEGSEYVNMCLNQLFASLLFIDTYRSAKHPNTDKQNTVFFSRALHFMKENLSNRITISDMAQALGYSESYFYRLFYHETKQAPMTYFMNLKVNLACNLLKNTDLRIYQVAMKVGFDDCYYFSRFFKKQVGYSPSQYRENICC